MIKDENYFDNCATTKPLPETLREFTAVNEECYFNASSLSDAAVTAHNRLNAAREAIKKAMGGLSGELIFTASGTEADNLAIRGGIKNNAAMNIVTTQGEHPAVYNTVRTFSNKGFEVRYCPLKSDGSLDTDKLPELVDNMTAAGIFMHVNNETGGITDIYKAADIVKSKSPKALVICDGVQAFGKIPLHLDGTNVDMYSVSAHKLYAPKGVGALWVKKGVNLSPIVYGGGQEKDLRSGTENLPGICAFQKAVELMDSFEEQQKRYTAFKDILTTHLSPLSDTIIIGGKAPNIFTVIFGGVKGEILLHMLESMGGFIVGIGSACSSKHRNNRITRAIGIKDSFSEGLIRISFSRYNTQQSVEQLAILLKSSVERLRGIQ